LPGVNAGENEFCIHSNQRRIEDFGTGPGEWGPSIGTCTQSKSIWRILSKSLLVYRIVHPPVIQANSSLRHCSQRARESWVRLPGRETLFALFYDEGFVRDVVRNEPSEAEDEARSEGATCGAGGQTPPADYLQCARSRKFLVDLVCPLLDASVYGGIIVFLVLRHWSINSFDADFHVLVDFPRRGAGARSGPGS
jgi:hypothetical protein